MNSECEWDVMTDYGVVKIAASTLEEAESLARFDGYTILKCYMDGCKQRVTTECEGQSCCSHHRDLYDGYITGE